MNPERIKTEPRPEPAQEEEQQTTIDPEITRVASQIFREAETLQDRSRFAKQILLGALDQEPTRSLLQEEERERMLAEFDEVTYEDERTFAEQVQSIVEPIGRLKAEHPLEYEDADALTIMEQQGFTPVNERVSYSLGDDLLQLHLAPSVERKDQIEDMYQDALEKIVATVEADPNITRVGGASWLNATRTYGGMKERLGFTLSELSEEDREAHFADEDRPVKNALMTREEFLSRYGKK